ncbi:MAG: hypothetical protein AAF513_04490 [Pseudomonadota bacterium]
MNDTDLIYASLEACAEHLGDITPEIFARFFARDVAAGDLMRHTDPHIQGRMFESMVELFLHDHHFEPGGYLEWELENHIDAYTATPTMYASLLEATMEVVAGALGAEWDERYEAAWRARCERIMHGVHQHYRPS